MSRFFQAIPKIFARPQRVQAFTALAGHNQEDDMMKECTMLDDQCSMNGQRTGAGPRPPLGQPGLAGQLGRWAAVAAVAAGAWLERAREAEIAA